jgi:hypothetical protein
MADFSYELGFTTSGSSTNLELMTVPVSPPKSTYHPYSKQLILGDGSVRGGGWPTATWSWDVITTTERDQLRLYCTGQSSTVKVRTRTMDTSDSYQTFTGTMIWPIDKEERDGPSMGVHTRKDFVLTFQNLVLV